jgi:hypothetical protein
MRRIVWSVAAVWLVVLASGCCASPYRFWQNAYGFNDPVPDCFSYGPPPPVTTPPGPTTPAAVLTLPSVTSASTD